MATVTLTKQQQTILASPLAAAGFDKSCIERLGQIGVKTLGELMQTTYAQATQAVSGDDLRAVLRLHNLLHPPGTKFVLER